LQFGRLNFFDASFSDRVCHWQCAGTGNPPALSWRAAFTLDRKYTRTRLLVEHLTTSLDVITLRSELLPTSMISIYMASTDRIISGHADMIKQRKRRRKKIKWLLSPLKYQRHAYRSGRLSIKSLCGCDHHLHCSQTLPEGRYTRIALFNGLAGKFGLLLDLNFISQHEHRHDGYALGFEKPEKDL
jgi:hypothetical protein